MFFLNFFLDKLNKKDYHKICRSDYGKINNQRYPSKNG